MRRFAVFLACLSSLTLGASEPCVSGVPVGERPGPYTFVVATGKERGQLTCYICETGDKPAIVIFARQPHDSLGRLVAAIDRAVADPINAPLRAWVTFLSDNQAAMDAAVVKWSKAQAIKNVPLGVFEDPQGPPSYRLADDADVTVMLFVKQRVRANFAFRVNELTPQACEAVLAEIPKILRDK